MSEEVLRRLEIYTHCEGSLNTRRKLLALPVGLLVPRVVRSYISAVSLKCKYSRL